MCMSKPKVPAAVPPPAPPPSPEVSDEAVATGAARERRRAQSRNGRQSTLLTGGMGAPQTAGKALTGS